ncbi:hypothetical protein [Streptomyces sp. NBC_00354]|uniref:hypothetical protein n=1 Tax=Streptomyces sp. NBC_00354 TaxID=2975723 RepID=UPI002E2756E5
MVVAVEPRRRRRHDLADQCTVDNVVRVFGIGPGGKVFGKDFNPGTGRWNNWTEVPGGAPGAKALTASGTGRTVHLQIIGSHQTMYPIDGNYATGQWSPWAGLGGTGLTALTSTAANNVVHVYATGDGGRVLGIDAAGMRPLECVHFAHRPPGSW